MTHRYILTVNGVRVKTAERLKGLKSEGEETRKLMPSPSPRREIKTNSSDGLDQRD